MLRVQSYNKVKKGTSSSKLYIHAYRLRFLGITSPSLLSESVTTSVSLAASPPVPKYVSVKISKRFA